MPRIDYPDPSSFDAETTAMMENLPPLNIFRMMGHAPHLIRPFANMGGAFLNDGILDPVTRECAILRVGYISEATYEYTQHEAIGRTLGMDDALFAAIRKGPGARSLTAEQRLTLMYTDCLLEMPKPTMTRLMPVKHHFGPAGLQELTLLIGFYMMVCRYLETFGVEVEDGGAQGAKVLQDA